VNCENCKNNDTTALNISQAEMIRVRDKEIAELCAELLQANDKLNRIKKILEVKSADN
jgi:hypothetical protein